MKIVINALQYKKNNSGIGILLRNLFGPYTALRTGAAGGNSGGGP